MFNCKSADGCQALFLRSDPFRGIRWLRNRKYRLCQILRRSVDRFRHDILDRTAPFALRFGIYGNARRVSRFAPERPSPSRKKHMQRKRTALRRSRRVRVQFHVHEPCQNRPCKAGKRPNALLRFCLSFRILSSDLPRLHTVTGESSALRRYPAGPVCGRPFCWLAGGRVSCFCPGACVDCALDWNPSQT